MDTRLGCEHFNVQISPVGNIAPPATISHYHGRVISSRKDYKSAFGNRISNNYRVINRPDIILYVTM